jgi:hypothetical protein
VSYYALVHSNGTVEAVEVDGFKNSNGWVYFYNKTEGTTYNGFWEEENTEVVLTLSPGFDGYFTPLTEEQYLLGQQEAKEDEANR